MIKVSALVVTHNRPELLKQNINALMSQKKPSLSSIIIVANQVDPYTERFLKDESKKNKKIIVIWSDKNLGGAGGFNLGIRTFIEKSNNDFIWIMDDDTIPKSNALNVLNIAAEKYKDFSFLISKVLWRDGTLSLMNVVGGPNKKTTADYNNQNGEVDKGTFVSILIPRAAILLAGLPQKEYFIWGDDMEYTERIKRETKQPAYYVGQSVVVHMSTKNLAPGSLLYETDLNRLNRINVEYRNRILTSRRRKSILQIVRTLGHNIIDLFKTLFYPHVFKRFKKAGGIVKGTINGFVFNPPIEKI
ncbi:MAG: glycosyltransferase [Lactobacillaceae bacterium]|jgi:GT2 family glycosyltransferase|nr:glycosyltransferase [Lactobacillaceae bacterium]